MLGHIDKMLNKNRHGSYGPYLLNGKVYINQIIAYVSISFQAEKNVINVKNIGT